MKRFRRILIRWEKKAANYLGLLHFACAWITSALPAGKKMCLSSEKNDRSGISGIEAGGAPSDGPRPRALAALFEHYRPRLRQLVAVPEKSVTISTRGTNYEEMRRTPCSRSQPV